MTAAVPAARHPGSHLWGKGLLCAVVALNSPALVFVLGGLVPEAGYELELVRLLGGIVLGLLSWITWAVSALVALWATVWRRIGWRDKVWCWLVVFLGLLALASVSRTMRWG